MTASVSAGSHCPVILNAVSPASNSSQRKDTSPAVEDLTVASTTSLVAFIISGPTPSPGMNGMTISLDNMITYLTQCEVSVLPQMRDEAAVLQQYLHRLWNRFRLGLLPCSRIGHFAGVEIHGNDISVLAPVSIALHQWEAHIEAASVEDPRVGFRNHCGHSCGLKRSRSLLPAGPAAEVPARDYDVSVPHFAREFRRDVLHHVLCHLVYF